MCCCCRNNKVWNYIDDLSTEPLEARVYLYVAPFIKYFADCIICT